MDPRTATGYESVDVLRATQRELNAAKAATLAAVVEVALRKPGSAHTVERLQIPHQYSPDEIRAALGLSASAAEKLLRLAWDTVKRLPELHHAMASGDLDETRAWALAEWTSELSDEHAHAICAELLPRAVLDAEEQLPTGQLIKEIQKAAIALDPTWAEKRFKASLRKRCVIGRANPDGTASLYGQQMELHRVAAACGRINTLARSAKKDGDPRPIDHLRSDLYLGMLDGTYEALTDKQILAALTRTRPERDGDDAEIDEPADTAEPVEQPSEAAPTPPHPAESKNSGVELRIRMTSLLGLDRAPAELANWGPIHVEYGQMLTALLAAARWRYVLTDDEGRFRSAGAIRTRPDGWDSRSARNHGIVDILVPESLLRDLVIGPLDGLELVDAERYRTWLPVLRELAERMQRPKPLPDDSNRRFPGRALRRVIELDKRRCIGIGCGRSATRCEIDHRLDWALHGRTIGVNLAPACGRDHGLKTKGGWTLHSWKPNGYRWCTALGREYVVSIPRVIEKVPIPRPDFWISDETGRDEPSGEVDSEGVPWQASSMWFPGGPDRTPADLGAHERRRPSVVDVIRQWKPAADDPPF